MVLKSISGNVCSKVFNKQNHLSRHILIHSDVRKYECSLCNKTYKTSVDLTQHKLIHSGIKKYQCDMCNKVSLSQVICQHINIYMVVLESISVMCAVRFLIIQVIYQDIG